MPTSPSATRLRTRSKPSRWAAAIPALDPRSLLMTSTCAQPRARTRSATASWRSLLSLFCRTCLSLDCRRYTIALRAKCSGLTLGLYTTSVIASPLLVKDCHHNAGHEIGEIGACRRVHRHRTAFLSNHQSLKLKLYHDDLPRIR